MDSEKFVPISLEPDPVIEAYKKDIDRTLLIENLKLTPTERLRKLMEMVAVYRELQRAGEQMLKRAAGRPRDLEAIAELEVLRELYEAQTEADEEGSI